MLHQILINTPRWVWVLLFALLWLGLSHTPDTIELLREWDEWR